MTALLFFPHRAEGLRRALGDWIASSPPAARWMARMVEGCRGNVGPLHETGLFLEEAWRLDMIAPGRAERMLVSWEDPKTDFRFPSEAAFLNDAPSLVRVLPWVSAVAGRPRMAPVREFMEVPERLAVELERLSGRSGGGRGRRSVRLQEKMDRWRKGAWTEKERLRLIRETEGALHGELREGATEIIRREIDRHCRRAARRVFGGDPDLSRTDLRTRFALLRLPATQSSSGDRFLPSLEGREWPVWRGTGMTVDEEGPLRVRYRVQTDPAAVLFGGERDATMCLPLDPDGGSLFPKARAVMTAEDADGCILDRRGLGGKADRPEWLVPVGKVLPDEGFQEAWKRARPVVEGAFEEK